MRSPLRVSRCPRRPLPARHRLDRAVGADLTDRPSVVATLEWPQVRLVSIEHACPCWRPNGAHPASCSAFGPILAMRTDACHRRKSLRALTTHPTRSALAWYPMAHQSVLRDGLRGEGRLGWRGRQTDTGFPGARFWGQVRVSSGRLRLLQGKGGSSGETSQIAGKARYQAPFPGHIAAGRILHGKEGVDGSSPSEGLRKSPASGDFVLPVEAGFRGPAGTRRVHFGTGGHSRARATSRDTPGACSRHSFSTTHSKSSCKQAVELSALARR